MVTKILSSYFELFYFNFFHSMQVSNTYSREVSGHGAIAPHLSKFFGILNGIDPEIWDPYNDNFIPVYCWSWSSTYILYCKSYAFCICMSLIN
jgi:glycogen synthase